MAPCDISIIIPVHNRAELLVSALRSVDRQVGAPAYEVIVVDDVSTDGSARVAAEAGARVVQHEINSGPGVARNTGIGAARGEWCAFLDSDDLWAPDHLRTLWAARDGVALVSTGGFCINAQHGRVLGSPFPRTMELRHPADVLRPENIINTSGTMVRTDVLADLGGFSTLRFSEDLELWLRIVEQHPARVVPRLTVGSRTHADQTSSNNPDGMLSGVLQALDTAEAGPDFSGRTRRRLATVRWWDALRAEGARPSARATVVHLPRLLPLLIGRFALRHRWQLPNSGADGVLDALRAERAA